MKKININFSDDTFVEELLIDYLFEVKEYEENIDYSEFPETIFESINIKSFKFNNDSNDYKIRYDYIIYFDKERTTTLYKVQTVMNINILDLLGFIYLNCR